MAALSVCQKEFANNRRRGRDCDLTMLRSDADIAPHGLLPARSRRGREDGTERKVELGCRKAENPPSWEPRQHKRQNSLGGAESLNFNDTDVTSIVPSECEQRLAPSLAPPTSAEVQTESIAWLQESKTARRRAEFNSKSKNITFNQKKHMTPSYIRRLERRRREGSPSDDVEADSCAVQPFLGRSLVGHRS
mmetsp:Transcript_11494/g.32606  ORF Transcript_11494/g.32606 Transcript_11494/m.32606 type:complete len:192 (-) Transcript_11494:352-927(-)|eukprot:CAMPEP_0117671172 /NCGR_PEP_ID=MMETSP0804-20121206/13181_1 /TAXON_ID=1074897 /ORGANISM="Tetraselmis astigmatica, Strain CCMP880" /LENGTH=191 /DNA_ID=CAMNT_0005479593 /DNA_START=434 /DNA_END=1009 /DNA_ORIENTATION=-